MAKYCHPDNIDAALDAIAAADKMVGCSAQPADYAGVAAILLSEVALAPGDFTKGDGGVSGRRLTIATKPGVSVTNPGTVTHVALVDEANTKLLYVTTTDNQEITDGSFVDFPEWSIEIADPV